VAALASVSQSAAVGQDDLRRFRTDVYDCLTARADALFELLDGLCSPVPVDGVAHVTLAAGCRRGHGSAYAALSCGGIDADLLGDVLAAHRPTDWPADFAVDVTTWPRCDAECSPGRGFYYHPSRHSAGQPIVAGWCYLWIAGLSASPDSWTAPLYAHRLAVGDNTNTIAAARVRALLPRLLARLEPGPLTPLFAFDAGFDPVQLSVGLSDVDVQIVVRIRDDRKFFTPPPPRRPGRGGRPRRHGDRFSCADPGTWPAPDAVHRCDDDQYGHVDVQAWYRLHPHQRTYRDPGGAMSIVEGTLIRLRVSRLPGRRNRQPKALWLWWTGPPDSTVDLDRVWRAYIRRFDIEHVRHEAHETVCGVRPHRRAVAAVRQKLGAAGPGERRERWKAAPTTPRRVGTTRRPGFGKRDQKVERE
jgi:DDE superfamily endonuclease